MVAFTWFHYRINQYILSRISHFPSPYSLVADTMIHVIAYISRSSLYLSYFRLSSIEGHVFIASIQYCLVPLTYVYFALHFLMHYNPVSKRLFTDTVSVNKTHLTDTVSVNKTQLTDTVSVNKKHLTDTQKIG